MLIARTLAHARNEVSLIEKMDASNNEWMQKMTDQQEKFMEMMLNNKPGGGDKRPRGGIKVCTGTTCKNCNKKGIHKDEDCFELESNAGRRNAIGSRYSLSRMNRGHTVRIWIYNNG